MNFSIAKDRLAAVVKPDSITTSEGDFLATHVEIKKLVLLNKFDVAPTPKKYISEEDIYKNYVLNPNNQHQFMVVYGQSGTGKSHLIRWFSARYDVDKPEDEVVLFIRRSDNTLKGTIRQLLEKSEVQEISSKDIIKRLVNASTAVPEDKLKDMIYHNFIIEINNDNDECEIKLNSIKKKKLVAFLNNEIIHDHMMEPDGPIERIYSKVAESSFVDPDVVAKYKPEDFIVSADLYETIQQAGADPKAVKMARALMADAAGAIDDAKKYCEYMNQFVSTVIQRCAGIEPADFQQVFMDIRKELYRLGKNLTLFIEDLTSFTGVDHALLNALMEVHDGRDICRISSIVGGTGAYINDFRDNHKDRVTQYAYIPDNVFDENGIFEFIGKYLNTMSLPIDVINHWVNSGAMPEEYPIHEIVEGKTWEWVETTQKQKLYLFPFSKNSIRYLYENVLEKGHQTPRYIIRMIIEPVVSDILYHSDEFPSDNYNLVNINSSLNVLVHNQIKDEHLADRVFRFMTIWGNNESKQYTLDNVIYLAGLPTFFYEELGLPVVSLQETTVVPASAPQPDPDPMPQPDPGSSISRDKQKKLDAANKKLTQWANGDSINLTSTGGAEGTIRTAREDMGEFVLSAINWQLEGVSMDNVEKVKASKYKLIVLENQTNGNGYYILPAKWESVSLINAFIRWRELGNQGWKYSGSDLDAYLITSWMFAVKDKIVKAVKYYDAENETKYIEAAIAAEMYRLILNGEYREKTLKNLSAEYLMIDHSGKNTNTFHAKEWLSVLSVMHQKDADNINKNTVRQYFKLLQGNSKGSVVVLDAINLSKAVRKVKANKLQIPENEIQSDDKVKLRKDTYSFLEDITSRIDNVAKAELAAARKAIQPVYDTFDDDNIEEEDIDALLTKISAFYKEINNVQINIKTMSIDRVKKAIKQVAKAIGDISNVMDEVDPLTILMAFSGDPIGTLQPLLMLINQVTADITEAERQIRIRKSKLGSSVSEEENDNSYKEEIAVIDSDIALLGVLR